MIVNRATLIEEYERKVEEFMQNPENLQDIAKRVYSRPLIQLLREIIKVSDWFKCLEFNIAF